MHVNKVIEILFFLTGFTLGAFLYPCWLSIQHKIHRQLALRNSVKYSTTLADHLARDIRIFCWVLTHPFNHRSKLPHIKLTWGRRCDKLVIFSTEEDENHPDIVALPNESGRDHLWNKTKLAMQYVHRHHLNDAEWFVRADDDNYFVVENLRHKLAQHNAKMALFIGSRYAVRDDDVSEGYIAGGGHIFSRKALTKFVQRLETDGDGVCPRDDGEPEDVFLGMCLKNHAIYVDAIDERHQKQMFPVSAELHMSATREDENFWYWNYLWRNVTQGGLNCCSELFISGHHVHPIDMHLLECLIYHVHPFGMERAGVESMPRKLTLDEVLKASDAASDSVNYVPHKPLHYFDSDERVEVSKTRGKVGKFT